MQPLGRQGRRRLLPLFFVVVVFLLAATHGSLAASPAKRATAPESPAEVAEVIAVAADKIALPGVNGSDPVVGPPPKTAAAAPGTNSSSFSAANATADSQLSAQQADLMATSAAVSSKGTQEDTAELVVANSSLVASTEGQGAKNSTVVTLPMAAEANTSREAKSVQGSSSSDDLPGAANASKVMTSEELTAKADLANGSMSGKVQAVEEGLNHSSSAAESGNFSAIPSGLNGTSAGDLAGFVMSKITNTTGPVKAADEIKEAASNSSALGDNIRANSSDLRSPLGSALVATNASAGSAERAPLPILTADLAINASLGAVDRPLVAGSGVAIESNLMPQMNKTMGQESNPAVSSQPSANETFSAAVDGSPPVAAAAAVPVSSNTAAATNMTTIEKAKEGEKAAAAAAAGGRTAGKLSSSRSDGGRAAADSLMGITCLMAAFMVSRHG